MIEVLIQSLLLLFFLLTAGGYMTWAERVLMARMQLRLGPNRVGPYGLLQPLADVIKLVTKERFQPDNIDAFTYWLAPAISLFSALFAFLLIPFGNPIELAGHTLRLQIADLNSGLLFFLAFSSLSVYGVILAGWSSNNRYSLLGGIRGTAQMISYEIPLVLSLIPIVLSTGSMQFSKIVEAQSSGWFLWSHPVSFLIFIVTSFAETNRAPFDLPEAEQELTAGYHTEYGGVKFAIFFLAEYVNILAVSSIAITLFLGGWHGPYDLPIVWFLAKLLFFIFFFILVRATMPRFRYDQLISFGWQVLTPLALINLMVSALFTLRLQ